MEIGVSGYIPKSSPNAVILGAINLVLAGGVYIPHELLNNDTGNNEITQEFQKLKSLSELGEAPREKRKNSRRVRLMWCAPLPEVCQIKLLRMSSD